MDAVLTLIANPLSADHIAAAQNLLPGLATESWLAPEHAADLFFEGDPDAANMSLRDAFSGQPVDVLAQSVQGRRKQLLIADMDSTIITVECIDEMADMLGLKAKVAAITESAMRGEIDFPDALRQRATMLAGLSLSDMEKVYAERINLSPGAKALVATMNANGAFCALVSGGFKFFTAKVRAAAGFDVDISNALEVEGGKLTGRLVGEIVDSATKLAALKKFAADHKLQLSDCLAVGDGANDLPMVQAAGLGVAYHAKPIVAEAARARVNHNDLTALLYFQGYRIDEFLEA